MVMLPNVYHYLAAPAAELLDKMGSNFSTFAEIYFCSVPGFTYIFFLNLNTYLEVCFHISTFSILKDLQPKVAMGTFYLERRKFLFCLSISRSMQS